MPESSRTPTSSGWTGATPGSTSRSGEASTPAPADHWPAPKGGSPSSGSSIACATSGYRRLSTVPRAHGGSATRRPSSCAASTSCISSSRRSARTRAVDDIEQIKQLKARYFRTMDMKDWDAMRQVFTDDAVIDTTASGGPVVTGGDEFIAYLKATIGDVLTVHHGHMPEIELTSATTARGIWSMEDKNK